MPAIFKLTLNDVPVFVILKAVSWDRRRDRSIEGALGLPIVATLCCFAGIALMIRLVLSLQKELAVTMQEG